MTTQTRNVQVVGTSFRRGATEFLTKCKAGTKFKVWRDPTNEYDENAIAVGWGDSQIGYLPKTLAAKLAPLMDTGLVLSAIKARVQGCVVTLSYDGDPVEDDPVEEERVFRGGPEIPEMNRRGTPRPTR